MKRTISVWACLAIVALSPLRAKELDTLSSAPSKSTEVDTSEPAEKPTELHLIPDIQLDLKQDVRNEVLDVTLKGSDSAQLEWVIFQPKGAVISRIKTSSKINEIKIGNLTAGDYVLMIKDEEGRALFQTFTKA